jgi:hypothetical protein
LSVTLYSISCVPFFRHDEFLTFPAILFSSLWMQNRLIFLMFFSVFFSLNVIKHGASIFTLTILLDGCELMSDFHCCVLGMKKPFRKGPPSRNVSVSLPLEGWENKDTAVFQPVPAWGSPSQVTDNCTPNGKSYTIGELQLHAPIIRITAHGPPLYTTKIRIGLHGFKGLVVYYMQLPVSGNTLKQHSQTNS